MKILIGCGLRLLPFAVWLGVAAVVNQWYDRDVAAGWATAALLAYLLFFPLERAAAFLYGERDYRQKPGVRWAEPSLWRSLRYHLLRWTGRL